MHCIKISHSDLMSCRPNGWLAHGSWSGLGDGSSAGGTVSASSDHICTRSARPAFDASSALVEHIEAMLVSSLQQRTAAILAVVLLKYLKCQIPAAKSIHMTQNDENVL